VTRAWWPTVVAVVAAFAVASPGVAGAAGGTAHAKEKHAALQRKRDSRISVLRIRTIPAVPGATFVLDGRRLVADRRGLLVAQVRNLGGATDRLRALEVHLGPDALARFKQWHGHLNVLPSRQHRGELTKALTATYDLYYRVRFTFTDDVGKRPPDPIREVRLRASTGVVQTFRPTAAKVQWRWIWGKRVVPYHDSLQVKNVYWVIDRVGIDGSNVVNRSQQKIVPSAVVRRIFPIHLLYFAAKIHARDAVFPLSASSKVKLRFPDGTIRTYPLSHGRLTLKALPRGNYEVKPVGLGIGFWAPVELSRNQVIDVKLISYLDIAVIAFFLAGVAFALAAARRPALRRRALAALTLSRASR
jgi:hypothetical protein